MISPYVTIVIILIVFYHIRSLDHVYHMPYPIISHDVTLYHIIHHNIHQSLVICSSWSPMIGYVIIYHYINIYQINSHPYLINVGKTTIDHPPVITIFTGAMVTIPKWVAYGIVLPTLCH